MPPAGTAQRTWLAGCLTDHATGFAWGPACISILVMFRGGMGGPSGGECTICEYMHCTKSCIYWASVQPVQHCRQSTSSCVLSKSRIWMTHLWPIPECGRDDCMWAHYVVTAWGRQALETCYKVHRDNAHRTLAACRLQPAAACTAMRRCCKDKLHI